MFSPAATHLLAIVVLALLGLAIAAWAAACLRRSPLTPVESLLYAANYLWARVLWRAQVDAPLPVPPGQGAVIVCNHRCPCDPSFIALTVQRKVHWMVAREFCLHPGMAWFFRIVGAIPVNRAGIDTAATKLAIRYAQQGRLVALFPEGKINTTSDLLLPGRPGAALIALRARVPVVPCYVSGAPYDGTPLGALIMPAKVDLKVGQPIDLSPYYARQNDREVLEDLTRRFLEEIAALAGQPDFQPRLAGRFYKAEVAPWRD